MRERLGWGAIVAAAMALAGCGVGPQARFGEEVLRPHDGGMSSDAIDVRSVPDAGQPWPLVHTTPVAPIPAGTMRLLGDATAVFGVTTDGIVWALDAGATSVHQLVASGTDGRSMSITLAAQSLFWTDARAGTLHRTARDGSGDVVLATGLTAPGLVTADDDRVYWFEGGTDPEYGGAGGTIRSLPSDAAPGDSPAALVTIGPLSSVSSMAVAAGSLYWTPYIVGATVYYSNLLTAPVSALLAGAPGAAVPKVNPTYEQPYGLAALGATVYFGYYSDLWTTAVARIPEQNETPVLLSILPIDVGLSGLLIAGDWLMATGAGDDVRGVLQLYAAPAEGAGFVVVATDLALPAVMSPWGIAYVDRSGALVAFPLPLS